MAYGQPPTCRRGGCGQPADDRPAACEGDIGWCEMHRDEVRQTRFRLTVGVKPGKAGHRFSEAKEHA